MSCTVAIPSSPVFSPSRRSLSCKAASASPESVSVAVSSPAQAAPPAGSPLRPFALRAHLREEASPSPQPSAAAAASASAVSVPAGSVLKRRRPAPLVVPVCGGAAAAAAAAAVAAVESDPRNEVEEEGEEFAVYCRRGKGRRRVEMEDRHVAKVALGGDPKVAFFGVFDGHGGKSAAEFAAENMPKFMAEEMCKVGDSGETEQAVKRCYLKTDEEFLKREESGGACCVTALLQKGGLVVSNAGDCRAVLSRSGKAEALTSDHRASREDERERIENLGGFVVNYRGTWRVQGSLAVSRGIGDAHLKQWVVSSVTGTRASKIFLPRRRVSASRLASDAIRRVSDTSTPRRGTNEDSSVSERRRRLVGTQQYCSSEPGCRGPGDVAAGKTEGGGALETGSRPGRRGSARGGADGGHDGGAGGEKEDGVRRREAPALGARRRCPALVGGLGGGGGKAAGGGRRGGELGRWTPAGKRQRDVDWMDEERSGDVIFFASSVQFDL